VTATARSVELRSIAQEVADALPTTVEEVVVKGSVSRGVADDISDIEILVVTGRELELEDCFALAVACGLTDLGT
jgi:predicted nucleotidyltransferase